MCDREELLTRLTAEAVARYNDKVPDVVIENALAVQSSDSPAAVIENGSITLFVPSFIGIDSYVSALNSFFADKSFGASSAGFLKLTGQDSIEEFDRKPVYIGKFTFSGNVILMNFSL